MNLILDTHTFLWFTSASPELSATARDLIEDATNDLFLSVASPWEIGIKVSTGKLTLGRPINDFFERRMRETGVRLLPISLAHVACVATLPFHHRDPFDRMLIAQSLTESMNIVSADSVLDAYGVTRLW